MEKQPPTGNSTNGNNTEVPEKECHAAGGILSKDKLACCPKKCGHCGGKGCDANIALHLNLKMAGCALFCNNDSQQGRPPARSLARLRACARAQTGLLAENSAACLPFCLLCCWLCGTADARSFPGGNKTAARPKLRATTARAKPTRRPATADLLWSLLCGVVRSV